NPYSGRNDNVTDKNIGWRLIQRSSWSGTSHSTLGTGTNAGLISIWRLEMPSHARLSAISSLTQTTRSYIKQARRATVLLHPLPLRKYSGAIPEWRVKVPPHPNCAATPHSNPMNQL